MSDVLETAGIMAQDYDWYVSDIDTNYTPDGFSPEDQWIRGEELASLVQDHKLQFNWAVFSAVPKGFRSTVSAVPYADGNPDYWNGKNAMPQLDGALFEIVCWDSSATILINLPAEAQSRFIAAYSDTRPLSKARG